MFDIILTNIVTTSACIGAATWFMKKYLEKRLDNIYREREKLLETRLKLAEKYEEHSISIMANLLPDIQEVIYRSRNILRDILNSQKLSKVDELLDLWTRLTEYLYKYRLLLPRDTFERLHNYKRLLQNMSMMLGARVRLYKERKGENGIHCELMVLTQEEEQILGNNLPNIEHLHDEIENDLRKIIDEKTRIIN